MRIGVQTTLIVLVYAVVYPFLPGDQAIDRGPYLVVLTLAAAGAVVIARAPWPRLFELGLGQHALYAWSAADIVLISVGAVFSGLSKSDFFYLYALTTIFFAAAYPTRGQIVLLGFTVLSYVTVVLLTSWPLDVAATVFRVSTFCSIAFISSFLSRELLRQISAHAEAREESERRSTLLAVVASAARLLETRQVDSMYDTTAEALGRLGFRHSALLLRRDDGWTAWRPPEAALTAQGSPPGVTLGALDDLEQMSRPARWSRVDFGPLEALLPLDAAIALLAPVRSEGRVVALLLAAFVDDDGCGPAETEAAELLASRLGSAIESADYDRRLHQSDRRFRSLVQRSSDLIVVLSENWIVSYASDAVGALIGTDAGGVIGRDGRELIHPDDRAAFSMALKETRLARPAPPAIEARVRSASGEWRQIEVVLANLLEDDSVRGIVINGRDVTERRQLEDQLRHLALHDALTGLPNRTLFADRLDSALGRRTRSLPGESLAVLFIDLDQFKSVNDLLGHAVGDALLIEAGERIAARVALGDTVARFGGDEFAVLIESASKQGDVEQIAVRILDALRRPFSLSGNDVTVTASLGIAPCLPHSASADELLQMADFAMYEAKSSGRDRFAVFDATVHSLMTARWELEGELRRAIEQSELELHYQPVVALRSGEVLGVEALVRWHHPSRGLIPPSGFIPIAEQTELIVPLGSWVLREALRQLRDWRLAYPHVEHLTMSINASMKQLIHPSLPDEVSALLDELGLPAASLIVEVTETALAERLDDVVGTLERLREIGVRIAIDDFGTGYSSLSYLRQLPVDLLKIDRSFVSSIGAGLGGEALVATIIRLGRQLGLQTVAEGIETREQRRDVERLGCDLGQGFLFAHPLAPADLELLLSDGAGKAGTLPRPVAA